MKTTTCPNCGAQISSSVCEFCGSKISLFNNTTTTDNSKAIKFSTKDILVAPFKIDRKGALKVVQDYFKFRLPKAYNLLQISEVSFTSYFIPIAVFTKFDKIHSFQFCCSKSELPEIFTFDSKLNHMYLQFPLHSYDYISNEIKKDTELSTAEIVITPNYKEVSPITAEFSKYAFTSYIPFWIVQGSLGHEYKFSMVFYGFESYDTYMNIEIAREIRQQAICRINNLSDEPVSIKSLKQVFETPIIVQEKAKAKKRKAIEKQQEKEYSQKRIKQFILFIITGAILGFFIGSLLGEVEVAGLVFGFVGAVIGVFLGIAKM